MLFNVSPAVTYFRLQARQVYDSLLSDIFQSDIVRRTKEIAGIAFSKMGEWSIRLDEQPTQPNFKIFAVASCICLMTLMAISLFKVKDYKAPIRREENRPFARKA
jgi:hypothetical protein